MLTIQIQPTCPKSFALNDKHFYPNTTDTITEEEYNSIEPYWKQHVTILSRDIIVNNINTICSTDISTFSSVCVFTNDSNDDDRISESNSSTILENININRTELVDLINKKPKTSTKKT